MAPRLELRGISKSYGGIRALQDVSFTVAPGEVHAVLGENGAGKSTLVRIVTGVEAADTGEVLLDGRPVRYRSPMAARAAGVVAVYQDPKLFPHLDVAENIFMGIQPTDRLGLVDRRRMDARARELLASLESGLEPATPVAGLSIAEAQFVEFARALAEGGDRMLILDEPTASLTPAETERLFRVVRRIRDRGTSVVLISHRLEELAGLVDTVTVLRDGHHVATRLAAGLDEAEVIRLMVGRNLDRAWGGGAADPGPERLRVERLTQAGAYEDVSLTLRAGEVVALAGLVGAGRSELARTLVGITIPGSGRILVDGHEVLPRRPGQMLRLGVAYLPEDRDGEGLVTTRSVVENVVLPIVGRLARLGFVRPGRERAVARRYAGELRIRAPSVEVAVAGLSGGNRQKVVLAKWLAAGPKVLILDEPTHGIDVGTKAQVHAIVRDLAYARRLAILLISSDLPEVLALGDRVLVMAGGRLTAELARGEATEERVMAAATARRHRPVAA
jgi:rhamnose transport system ATP-binding protein